MSRTQIKLNDGLDPEKFAVCVSTDCRLVLDDYKGASRDDGSRDPTEDDPKEHELREYLKDLGVRPDPEAQERSAQVRPAAAQSGQDAVPCDEPGPTRYLLRGRLAIEHARRVHSKIRRQLLRFDNVTAVDVGFAVRESRKKFLNALAIRIHVATKHPVSKLSRHRLIDLVSPAWAWRTPLRRQLPGRALKRAGGGDPWARMGVAPDDLSLVWVPEPDSSAPTPQPSTEGSWTADAPKPRRKGKGKQAAAAPKDAGVKSDASAECCHCCECCGRCCYWTCPKCRHCCCCCRCESTLPDGARCCRRWLDGGPECRRCRLAICGVPLDIIQATYFPAGAHPGGDFDDGVFVGRMENSNRFSDQENLLTGRGRVTPLVGGVSVGSVSGLAGTLGAVVWDATDGSPCVLGNWHVLAGLGAKQGQPCYQPAIFDGGSHEDVIGHLKRWHLGDLGDAAIAELDGSRFFASGEILGMWHPISGYQAPELNLEIRKWGRTTGFTQGFIDGIHLATNIDYGNEFVRHFEGQFHIAPLRRGQEVSRVGDSGSLVLTVRDLDEVDKLELIARAMLRKSPDALITALRNLIGEATITDIEGLAKQIRALLDKCEPIDKRCQPTLRWPLPPAGSCLGSALDRCREAAHEDQGPKDDEAGKLLADFKNLLVCILEDNGIDVASFLAKKIDTQNREARRVYHAVGMIFAGDTPGSPFGEFALASDINKLAKDLRFSLRPVFEPRSSFRKLRSRPAGRRGRQGGGSGSAREPGEQGADPRGGGPQPEGATLQPGPGTGSGGG